MPDPLADYTAQAVRTESPITPALQTRLQQHARLVHALLGLQTEAGELADPVKKHIYYGRPLDLVNLREEIGDCLWYLAIAADALGTTLAAEQARNLAKLRARYPHVFTAEAARVRDLDREREVLEGDLAEDPATLRQKIDAARAESVGICEQCRKALEMISDSISTSLQLWNQLQMAKKSAAASIVERDAARAESATLREKLDAAEAAVSLQRAGIERLQAFAAKVREAHGNCELWGGSWASIGRALSELDDEPTTATEPVPCPECERLRVELTKSRDWASHCEEVRKDKSAELGFALEECERLQAFVDMVREATGLRSDVGSGSALNRIVEALAELDAEPAPVADPARCPECERLRAVIDQAWQRIQQSISHADVAGLLAALAEIQSNSSATLTSSVVKESLSTEPEGVK